MSNNNEKKCFMTITVGYLNVIMIDLTCTMQGCLCRQEREIIISFYDGKADMIRGESSVGSLDE